MVGGSFSMRRPACTNVNGNTVKAEFTKSRNSTIGSGSVHFTELTLASLANLASELICTYNPFTPIPLIWLCWVLCTLMTFNPLKELRFNPESRHISRQGVLQFLPLVSKYRLNFGLSLVQTGPLSTLTLFCPYLSPLQTLNRSFLSCYTQSLQSQLLI